MPLPVATGDGVAKAADVSPREARAQRRLRRCTNRARTAHGLRALKGDRALNGAARMHADNMRRYHFFNHTDQAGRDLAERVAMFRPRRRFRGLGENLAAGGIGAKRTCRAWMRSSGHRATMLGHWSRIGVGVAFTRSGMRYFVAVFGRYG